MVQGSVTGREIFGARWSARIAGTIEIWVQLGDSFSMTNVEKFSKRFPVSTADLHTHVHTHAPVHRGLSPCANIPGCLYLHTYTSKEYLMFKI